MIKTEDKYLHLANLHPVYFAMVMATGIISINFKLQGFETAATALFFINLILYFALTILFISRALFFRTKFINDLSDHQRAPGFFTIVAANSIVGSQSILMTGSVFAAQFFFGLALILWILSIYSIFVLLTVKSEKPAFEQAIHGGWLVAIVATQSIPVVGTSFLDSSVNHDLILFLLTVLWLFGGMLYIWIISIIFYRYMFFKFNPNDLMPPYWINMGAMAISTLAGALLVQKSSHSSLLLPLLPFIKGFTLMFWATATWWIPMLFLLGFWRHIIKKIPISYTPLYWGLVFPLGMYAVCTIRLGQIFPEAVWLKQLVKVFTVLGIVAWTITFLGMLTRFLSITFPTLNAVTARGNRIKNIGQGFIITAFVFYCLNQYLYSIPNFLTLLFITIGAMIWIIGNMHKVKHHD